MKTLQDYIDKLNALNFKEMYELGIGKKYVLMKALPSPR